MLIVRTKAGAVVKAVAAIVWAKRRMVITAFNCVSRVLGRIIGRLVVVPVVVVVGDTLGPSLVVNRAVYCCPDVAKTLYLEAVRLLRRKQLADIVCAMRLAERRYEPYYLGAVAAYFGPCPASPAVPSV